ncbi:MAG: cytochrome c3 family protein [Coriobacteriales bacterium]|jgi:hypothetical protein|nr:cytochrome c3 family protein [Coriobacteriales bacterium]
MKTPRKLVLALGLCALLMGLSIMNGCAPRERQPDDVGENASELPVMSFTWSPESECDVCHGTEELSWGDRTTTAGLHNPSVISDQFDCMTCHNDRAGLTSAHEEVIIGDKAPTRLWETEVATETCTASGCHDDEAARREATAGLTLLTDTKGTTVNPHDLPTGEGHSGFTCSSCHKGHAASEPEKFCTSCHHERVYECGTCH